VTEPRFEFLPRDLMEDDGVERGDRVQEWRQKVLERAGYGIVDAMRLAANRDVDLHLAVQLIRTGCPHSTAVRILT